jgi:hypothetical protein
LQAKCELQTAKLSASAAKAARLMILKADVPRCKPAGSRRSSRTQRRLPGRDGGQAAGLISGSGRQFFE